MSSKATLAYRKANNLCEKCGELNAVDKKMCQKHLDIASDRAKQARQKKKERGICLRCNNLANEGKTHCEECRIKSRPYDKQRKRQKYIKRIIKKVCTNCGKNDAAENKVYCQFCLDRRSDTKRVRYDKLIIQDDCVQCGQSKINEGKRCNTCIEKRNTWYQGSITQAKDKVKRDENRRLALEYYGAKCACCGVEGLPFLAIDHIEGAGNTHRKAINRYGSTFFRWLVDSNFPPGFQVLCHNCNVGRYWNGGICPHQDGV